MYRPGQWVLLEGGELGLVTGPIRNGTMQVQCGTRLVTVRVEEECAMTPEEQDDWKGWSDEDR
jgi:hypothetical protein